jgi:spoIIIJ-associated protein
MSNLQFQGEDLNKAIESACEALNISKENLKYEVIETKKKGLFSKGSVKISVQTKYPGNDLPIFVGEEKIRSFLEILLQKMGMIGKVEVNFKEDNKIGLSIVSDDSGLLIGRRGKTLDALQLIVNIVAGRIDEENKIKVIVDSQNYRTKRQEKIVSLAQRIADQVRRSGGSRLLEPMNPFERRIIHTTLNNLEDIETISEGEGLYKQIRICFKGKKY